MTAFFEKCKDYLTKTSRAAGRLPCPFSAPQRPPPDLFLPSFQKRVEKNAVLCYDVTMRLEYLECGRILAPHGVRGAMRIEVWCDSPAVAAALPTLFIKAGNGLYTGYRLLQASVHKGGLLATLEGVTTPEAVAPLRGVTVYARREHLDPRGERVFLAETVGLPVLHEADGRLLGRVREVDTSRRTTLYVIETEGGEVLLPAVPEFVKEIDVERGMTVRPIPGFFDEV